MMKEIQNEIKHLEAANNGEEFHTAMESIQRYMMKTGCRARDLEELRERAYYIPNEYSPKAEKESMHTAKSRVIDYIYQLQSTALEYNVLLQVLENYYLFMENLIERKPHKKAALCAEQLQCLTVKNEYDIQHLLYAYLKPLYPNARPEVNEDTGYGTVRTDILLDAEHVIEVKFTRKSMTLKKLIEEIESDMVHYEAKNIYFFIYDKLKLVQNPVVFKNTYEEKLQEKNIHIILHQPKEL